MSPRRNGSEKEQGEFREGTCELEESESEEDVNHDNEFHPPETLEDVHWHRRPIHDLVGA
jgi:hypothetical protein